MKKNDTYRQAFAMSFVLLFSLTAFFPNTVAAQRLSLAENNPQAAYTALPPGNRDSGHVYRMNYWRSIGFSAVALAANLWATPNLIKDKKPLTDAELAALNPNIFTDLDKWALNLDVDMERRDKLNVTSDHVLTLTSIGAAALLLDKRIRKNFGRVVTLYVETSMTTFAFYTWSPFGALFNNKIRPLAYYENFPRELRKNGNSRNAFYSGHVANAAASTFFMVKVYSDYHPEIGGKKYLLYGAATIPPLLISYLRVKSLFHFPSDCLVGLIIGGAVGVLVPETHRIKNKKGLQLGMSSLSDVPAVAVKWKF